LRFWIRSLLRQLEKREKERTAWKRARKEDKRRLVGCGVSEFSLPRQTSTLQVLFDKNEAVDGALGALFVDLRTRGGGAMYVVVAAMEMVPEAAPN